MVGRHRVLMTVDTLGGVWQYACSLAPGLQREGFDVLMAVLGPDPDQAQHALIAGLDGIELMTPGLPLDWVGSSRGEMTSTAQKLAAIAASEGCDIVHLNSPLLAAGARFPAPVVAVAHGCVSSWWQAARSDPLASEFHWHRDMTAKGLRLSDAVVAPTRAYAQTLRQCYALSRPVEAVYNGRPTPAQIPRAASHDFCFTAGRLWDDVKNTPVLDRIAERLPFPFHAAGRCAGPNGELVTPSHLSLLGQLSEDEMARWLAPRPVFVSAALFEPFGLAVLEAAQAGCPLVLSDIPTFRELWDGAAIFLKPDDVAGYAHAIFECVADPCTRYDWGERARQRATRYTPAAMATHMGQVYSALLEERAAA